MSRLLAVVAACLAACGGGASEEAAPRPNLVLVLTDDQRRDALSCYGNEWIDTPELDRLAAEGARFDRAYVTTSLCCPARASLYTGLYPHAHGVRNNEDRVDFLGEHLDLFELLQDAGYQTGFFGKWHVPNPGARPQPGIDRWVSFEGQGRYRDEIFNLDGELRRIEGFNTDVLFSLALSWVREVHERGPFLCVLSLKNLHGPYDVPERHRGLLGEEEFPLPESFHDDRTDDPAYVQRVRTTLRNRFFDDDGTHAQYVRAYHLMVLSVDDNMGRLMDSLDRHGIADQTLLAFTSDGGFMWGEHGLYRKRTAYEPSVGVPLLLRYPAEVSAGTELDALATTVDLLPTFLDLAGVEPPSTLHGTSLRPLWREEGPPWRDGFLYIDGWGKYVDGPQELALVGERYKLIRYRRNHVEDALFDLEEDPEERTSLARVPAHAGLLEDLRARLAAALAEVDAPGRWMRALEVGSDEDE